MLRKIDCELLHVEDLDRAASYYQSTSGVRILWRRDTQVALGMPETDAEVVLTNDPQFPPDGLVHSLVDDVVDDVRAAIEHLTRQGCATTGAPLEIAIGLCAQVMDPFGNRHTLLDMARSPHETDETPPPVWVRSDHQPNT